MSTNTPVTPDGAPSPADPQPENLREATGSKEVESVGVEAGATGSQPSSPSEAVSPSDVASPADAEPRFFEANAPSQEPQPSHEQAGAAGPLDVSAKHRADHDAQREAEDATAVRRRSLFAQGSPQSTDAGSPVSTGPAGAAGTTSSATDDEHSWPMSEELGTAMATSFEALVSPGSAPLSRAPIPDVPLSWGPQSPSAVEVHPDLPPLPAHLTQSMVADSGQPDGVGYQTPAPGTAPDRLATQVAGATPGEAANRDQARSELDILLDGSVVVGKPASRALAHWLGILLAIVLLPISWFCLHKGLTAQIAHAQAFHFGISLTGLLYLAGGCLACIGALWGARRSSVGMWIAGVVTLIAGLPALVIPSILNDYLSPELERMAQQSWLGDAVARMIWSDALSGRLLMAGVALIMVGVVSHSARRAGRREQEIIDRLPHSSDIDQSTPAQGASRS